VDVQLQTFLYPNMSSVSIFKSRDGEGVSTNSTLEKRDGQTKHIELFRPPAAHEVSDHTWRGDRGGLYHSGTSKTFLPPVYTFAARGVENFGEMHLPRLNPITPEPFEQISNLSG